MNRRARIRTAVGVAAATILIAACGSSGGQPTPTPSGVTVDAATTAVRGLCDMRNRYADDLERANGPFYDAAHETLHAIAAAAEEKDRVAAAKLLEAKEKVESELRFDVLPDVFPDDVGKLIDATRAALDVLGIDVPACPA
ncbi:MAG: hypothetical protein HYU54_08190 [Actinobacteria bacterium]|nr:hypothetical protein [Actinomycetota bacterium]